MDALRSAIERAVGNQYEVLHLLGRGGMGAVYLARDRFLERLVAIKILPEAGDAEGRERFLREARTAARLTHPSIVPLHTFSQFEDTLLYVMGYVEGESLEALLRREHSLPAERATRIMREIADALAYAHEMGVVHRDVKPDNILIDRDTGRAYLTDFGIAKMASARTMTRTGMVVGTPHYMAPEQGAGDAVDARADLYALGVIGYRMVSGRLPFDASTPQELAFQHAAREAVPLTPDAARPELTTVIMRCLAKDPAQRWQAGGEIITALKDRDPFDLGLPDEMDGIPGNLGTALLVWGVFDVALFAISQFSGLEEWRRMMVIGPLVTVPMIAIADITQGRRHGIPWRQALKIGFMPPAKWSGWWPKALRRRGDVWPLLPAAIRRVRTIFTALTVGNVVVGMPLIIYTLSRFLKHDMTGGNLAGNAVVAVGALNGIVLLATIVSTIRWPKRFNVGEWASKQLIAAPTWNNSLWKRPEVAALLGKNAATAAPASPRTPAQLVEQIEAVAGELPTELAPAAADARRAARDVLAFATVVERELAATAQDADPDERARIAERIANDKAVESPMRRLLEQQLSLYDQLSARRQQLLDDRARCMALLQRLHLQLVRTRVDLAEASASPSSLSGQIRAVCQDLDHERAAVAEVRRALVNT